MENDGYENVEMTPAKKAENGDTTYTEVEHDLEQGSSSGSTEKKKQLCTRPYAGMGKEELLQFSQTPGWRAARWICLLIILAGWCAMLAMAIVLIVTTPRCLPWWQSAVVYQIFPRTFQDSDGNGVGDIRGIIDRVDYINSLHVDAVMLSAVYKSGGKDNSEDIVDFNDVDTELGTMDDMSDLVQALHDLNIKLILDFIPNHSSDKHEFFNRSLNSEISDYYYWANEVYNNWGSLYSGSAWTHDNAEEKFFFHQYSEYQPDFNLRWPAVLRHLSDALETWFTLGVDGLNIRGVNYLYERRDPTDADEPPNPDYQNPGSSLQQYDETLHVYTAEYGNEAHDLLQKWQNDVFYKYSTAGTYRVMLTDCGSNSTYAQSFYGTDDSPEADLPMNYNLLEIGDPSGLGGEVTGREIDTLVKSWMGSMTREGNWPNFQLGNYAASRIASRLNRLYSKVANILLLTLPGTPICYYGDEIGMEDIVLTEFSQVKDLRAISDPQLWRSKTRDPQRSPMQWDTSEPNAGFSSNMSTYLPVHTNYQDVNVMSQEEEESSVLSVFRRMTQLRRDNRAFHSDRITYIMSSDEVFAYVREVLRTRERFFIALNFGNVDSEEDYYHTNDGNQLPIQGTVVVATNTERESSRVELNKLHLAPGEGVVVLLDEIVYVSDSWWYQYFRPAPEPSN
ncbi:amino acid transporter heavy chain SLC3A1-like [Diadema antillarum]|uniref:amino acid transporter heavy chain SLC3A1-like n=1 Tax=Diadema antillarum TaxID=105358 RepID=UPI003A8780A3